MARRIVLPRDPAVIFRRGVQEEIALRTPAVVGGSQPLLLQPRARSLGNLGNLVDEFVRLLMENAEVVALGQAPSVVSACHVANAYRRLGSIALHSRTCGAALLDFGQEVFAVFQPWRQVESLVYFVLQLRPVRIGPVRMLQLFYYAKKLA